MKRWNRSGTQDCSSDGETLFCILQVSVTAEIRRYHHAQPAVDLVRRAITERFRDRYAGHILVDFNNNAATTADEVRSLLELAIERARAEAGGR